MSNQIPKTNSRVWLQVLLWGLVALYTFLIPDAIILYRFIETRFGSVITGKIPLFLVLIIGIAYVVYLRISNTSLKNLAYIIPCAIIVISIFILESNPNKRIHIPEYVVLSWLVYAALSRKYQGKGIFILIFICTSMLGVVDELEQGIHPGRFYGLSDMMVNSASALIGVFTILGLTKRKAAGWEWIRFLKKFTGLLWLILFGLTVVVLMCVNLFMVQASGGIFRGVYPEWLLALNILYLVITPVFVFYYRNRIRKNNQIPIDNNDSIGLPEQATAQLWVYPVLVILFYMHLLLVYISISGVIFK
jgi:hypothetical protein